MRKVKIKKRDGSFQEFNLDKVKFAIQKAFKACQYDMNKLDLTDLYCDIEESIPGVVEDETIELEELQDLIEEVLMDFGYKDVAKNYILYRYQRKVAREQKFAEKLSGSNIENQNANVDEMSFGGRQGEASRIMTKDYALEHCVSKVAKENHLNNEVYIHDLDSLAVGMHNCCDRSTKFITDKGVFSFEDFNDGDKVTVLTHTGSFKPATVHCYGKQKLYNISFNRSGRIVQEKFTLNHRWILDTGEITTNLKVGDKLYKTPSIIANLDFLSSYKNSNDYWQVINIEESDEKDVWCLDVEEDHSFVLPNGIVTGNCLSLPIDKLLENGFVTRQTDVRPANSINTAFQLVAVLFQLQSLQQFGGVSCTHLDWTMVPYVRTSFWKHYNNLCKLVPFCKSKGYYNLDSKEIKSTPITSTKYCGKYWFSFVRKYIHSMAMYLTRKETRQAVEGMFHNLNTLQSRSGNQLPFTSVNFGTCTLSEGRMVIEELLNGSINGVGKYHRTPIFPCSIFQYMKGINDKPGTPNYDLYKLALKSTSERLYPNYVNVDWSGNSGYDINDPRTYMSTMGCRTANGWDINGFGQLKDGRGNICPVTIILPTLAMESFKEVSTTSEGDVKQEQVVENFLNRLQVKIEEARDMLLERFEWICKQDPSSAKFMWENNTMAGYIPEEGIRSALRHGTLAVGQLGLAEALQILIGCDHTEARGLELAKKIEEIFAANCKEYKNKYKLNFGVYYTPAENLCYTALKQFRDKYGVIKNVSDKEFFTNSMHVPVWHKITPFEKIDIESQLTGYSSAGCITYTELPSTTKHNIEALETIVNYAMSKDIPYFAVNIPVDDCDDCGASGEFNDVCPECGSKNIKRLRRVTGYLTGDYTSAFNLGKQDETNRREKHCKVID